MKVGFTSVNLSIIRNVGITALLVLGKANKSVPRRSSKYLLY